MVSSRFLVLRGKLARAFRGFPTACRVRWAGTLPTLLSCCQSALDTILAPCSKQSPPPPHSGKRPSARPAFEASALQELDEDDEGDVDVPPIPPASAAESEPEIGSPSAVDEHDLYGKRSQSFGYGQVAVETQFDFDSVDPATLPWIWEDDVWLRKRDTGECTHHSHPDNGPGVRVRVPDEESGAQKKETW